MDVWLNPTFGWCKKFHCDLSASVPSLTSALSIPSTSPSWKIDSLINPVVLVTIAVAVRLSLGIKYCASASEPRVPKFNVDNPLLNLSCVSNLWYTNKFDSAMFAPSCSPPSVAVTVSVIVWLNTCAGCAIKLMLNILSISSSVSWYSFQIAKSSICK